MNSISVQELQTILKATNADGEVLVIDVRSPDEYQDIHIENVRNIPLDELENRMDELRGHKNVYIHCGTGGRSAEACSFLQGLDVPNVFNVDGGIEAWEEAGLPVVS